MKARHGYPSIEPGQHFEAANSEGSANDPIDLEKSSRNTAAESGDYPLSPITTHDENAVVTAKTWAVVVVRLLQHACLFICF